MPVGSGNSLAGSEKMKTPSFRIHEADLAAFDEYVENETDWSDRSDALRTLIDREMNGREAAIEGLQPPTEPQLAKAYDILRQLTQITEGWVPANVAAGELAQQFGTDKKTVRRMLLAPLRKRGYVEWQTDLTGYSAVRARL